MATSSRTFHRVPTIAPAPAPMTIPGKPIDSSSISSCETPLSQTDNTIRRGPRQVLCHDVPQRRRSVGEFKMPVEGIVATGHGMTGEMAEIVVRRQGQYVLGRSDLNTRGAERNTGRSP